MNSGSDVEQKYAQALAEAHWKVYGKKLTWYFLYVSEWTSHAGAPSNTRRRSGGRRW